MIKWWKVHIGRRGFFIIIMLGATAIAATAGAAEPKRHVETKSLSMESATSLAFPKSGVVRVPFTRGAANHVLVETRDAKGVARTFAIDTGASFSVLTPNYMASRKPAASGDSDEGEVIEAHGAHGAIQGGMTMTQISDLRVGDLVIEQAGAVTMDIPHLDEGLGEKLYGIIGFNVLSQLTMVIDYAAQEVVFIESGRDAEAEAFGDPDHVVPFDLRMGVMIELEGRIDGGEPIPFLYDVGSPRTMLNAPASEASKIEFREDEGRRAQRIAEFNRGMKSLSGKAKALHFGDLTFDSPTIYSMDLPVFGQLGMGDTSAGLLGNDMFTGHRVAIDYAAKELRVWKVEEAAAN